MLKLHLISIFLLNCILCFCQEISTSLVDSLSFQKNKYRNFIGIDAYDNLFFTKREVVSKIKGNNEWVYTNYELGIPTSVSLLNPLQILVFYKENNTVVLLDRFLNETRRIELNNLSPLRTAWWVENTKSQQLWLYDGESSQLDFFNYQNNSSLYKSIPFLEQPVQLASDFNTAYVLFKDKLNRYNIYGTLMHSIPLSNYTNLSIDYSKVLLKKEYLFQVFDNRLNSLGKFKLKKNNSSGFSLRDEKLYIYALDKLYIYQLTYPSK